MSNYYDSRLSCGAGSLFECSLTTSGMDVVGIIEDGCDASAYVATVLDGRIGDEMPDLKWLSSLEAY